MEIEFDPAKRKATLAARDLDMAAAADVFAGGVFTMPDDRKDYGEVRFMSVGRLAGRMVVLVWTPRGEVRRIISMRKANATEQALYGRHFR